MNEIKLTEDELKYLQLLASGFVTGGFLGSLIPLESAAVEFAKLQGKYHQQLIEELKKFDGFDNSMLNERYPNNFRERLREIIIDKSIEVKNLLPKPVDGVEQKITINKDDGEEIYILYQWYLNKIGDYGAPDSYVTLYNFNQDALTALVEPLLELSALQIKLEAIQIVEDEVILNEVYKYLLEVKSVPEACKHVLKKAGGTTKISESELKEKVKSEYKILHPPKKSTINDSVISFISNRKKHGYKFKKES